MLFVDELKIIFCLAGNSKNLQSSKWINKYMVEKWRQAKIKHHHVWAEYLRRWSLNNKDIYFTTAKGQIVCGSAKGVAMEKNFYQVKPLTNLHVKVIKGFSALCNKDLQAQHISYLNDFLLRQALEDSYSGLQSEVDEVIWATKCNIIENLHSQHEDDVKLIIVALVNRDLTVLNEPKNFLLFVQFFAHQISRTKTFRDTIITGMSVVSKNAAINLTEIIAECWWFISYMFGMNIGLSLYDGRNEDRHCLLINDSDTPFITSDQPVVNVHESLQDDVIIAPSDECCDFYYPISPQVAYMINKSDRFNQGINIISADIANELNIKIAKKANVHIIGNSEKSLDALKKYVGMRLVKVKEMV